MKEKQNAVPLLKKLRRVGLVLAAISSALVTAPLTLPALVLMIAAYAGLAGSLLALVSKAFLDEEQERGTKKPGRTTWPRKRAAPVQ